VDPERCIELGGLEVGEDGSVAWSPREKSELDPVRNTIETEMKQVNCLRRLEWADDNG